MRNLFSLLLSGCISLSAAAETKPAIYEVPVPAEWKEYARFPMEDFKVKEEEGKVRIFYTLPLEITGVKNKIHFEGKRGRDGRVHLSGAGGSEMECYQEGYNNICKAFYRGVIQDISAVEALLDSKNLSAQEKEIRLAVARHVARPMPRLAGAFMMLAARAGVDMEGVVTYEGAYSGE